MANLSLFRSGILFFRRCLHELTVLASACVLKYCPRSRILPLTLTCSSRAFSFQCRSLCLSSPFLLTSLRVPLMKRKLHESPGSQLSHAASRIAPLCCKGACPRALGPLHHGEYSVGVVMDSVYITLQRYAVRYDVLLTCGFAVYALCRWRRGVCCVYIVACSHAGSSRC